MASNGYWFKAFCLLFYIYSSDIIFVKPKTCFVETISEDTPDYNNSLKKTKISLVVAGKKYNLAEINNTKNLEEFRKIKDEIKEKISELELKLDMDEFFLL